MRTSVLVTTLTTGLVAGSWLAGCGYGVRPVTGHRDFESKIEFERTDGRAGNAGVTNVTGKARAHAQRVAANLKGPARNVPGAKNGPAVSVRGGVSKAGKEVQWLSPVSPKPSPERSQRNAAQEVVQITDPPQAAGQAPGREVLLEQLRRHIANDNASAIASAIDLATLSVLSGHSFDSSVVSGLSPDERKMISRYQELVQSLLHRVTTGQFARGDIEDQIGQLFDDEPIQIRQAKLVSSVDSWGVYKEFASNVHLAGREIPMIIYTELDNFHIAKIADNRYQVRLSQEVELYTDTSEGVKVWQQPEEQVVDFSRNRRHDFFTRQLIKLPVLNVGKYLLKVRVTDLNGGSVRERNLPIVLVADQALVSEETK